MKQICINPGAVEDWELEAYASGEAMPHVAEHLGHCPACQNKLAAMRAEEHLLQQRLYRFDCPLPAELQDYHHRSLPRHRHRQIKQHLRDCPHCAAELKALTDSLANIPERSPALPDKERRRSEQIGQIAGQMRLLVARLLAPDMNFSPVLRGETQDVLLFETEGGVAISAHTEPEGDGRFSLFGQVLATEIPAPLTGKAQLQARRSRTPPPLALLDPAGGFEFFHLLPDAYQLTILLPEQTVLVPHLVLGDG